MLGLAQTVVKMAEQLHAVLVDDAREDVAEEADGRVDDGHAQRQRTRPLGPVLWPEKTPSISGFCCGQWVLLRPAGSAAASGLVFGDEEYRVLPCSPAARRWR